jgi:hypothetical protein
MDNNESITQYILDRMDKEIEFSTEVRAMLDSPENEGIFHGVKYERFYSEEVVDLPDGITYPEGTTAIREVPKFKVEGKIFSLEEFCNLVEKSMQKNPS